MGLNLGSITDAIGLTDTEGAQDASDDAFAAVTFGLERARRNLQGARNRSERIIKRGFSEEADILRGGFKGQKRLINQGFARAKGLTGAGFDSASDRFQPLADIGTEAFERFSAGSTPEGFANNIEFLTSSGVLDPLIDERQRGVSSELASLGLSRSTGGLGDIADVSQDTLFGLEDRLSGRTFDTAQTGLPFVQGLAELDIGRGGALSDLTLGKTGALSELLAAFTSGKAGSTISEADALASLETQLGSNLANISTSLGSASAELSLSKEQANQDTLGQIFDFLGQVGKGAAAGAAGAPVPTG